MSARSLIVLGMHRGGTSALAGVLSRLGVDLGTHLLPATPFNAAGYFEDVDVVGLHDRVLWALGRTWHDVRPLPDSCWDDPLVEPHRARLRELLSERFGASPLWGVKDPRQSRLLGLWLPVLAALDVEPAFVLIARDPREVTASLAAREGFPEWKSQVLYLDHLLAAERDSRGFRRTFLTFEQLLGSPEETVRRLAGELDLGVAAIDGPLLGQVREFLEPSLRHHVAPVRAKPPGSPLEAIADRCFDQFGARAALDESQRRAAFDALQGEFEQARQPITAWAVDLCTELGAALAARQSELERARAGAAQLEREIAEARDGHRQRDRIEQDLRGWIAAQSGDLDRARQSLGVLETQIDEARLAHGARDANEAALKERLAEAEAQLDRARAAMSVLEAQIAQARDAHRARDLTEAELRRVLGERDAELEHEREALRAVEEERARAEVAAAALAASPIPDDEPKAAPPTTVVRQRIPASRPSPPTLRSALGRLRRRSSRVTGARRNLETSPEHLFVLEAPEAEAVPASQVELVGWCVAIDWPPITAIRARIGDRCFAGEVGGRRHDVQRVHGQLANAGTSGFRIPVDLGDGTSVLIEVQRVSDVWTWAARRRLRVGADPLLAAFDEPRVWTQRHGLVHFSGWCFHPQHAIEVLELRCGEIAAEVHGGMPRPDVGRAFPGVPGSASAGFEIALRLPPGRYPISLCAQLETGESVEFVAAEQLNATRRDVAGRARRMLRAVTLAPRFVRYGVGLGLDYRRRHRGFPPLRRVPGMLKRAAKRFRERHAIVPLGTFPPSFQLPPRAEPYDAWLAVNGWNAAAREELALRLAAHGDRLPTISVVMPVYNPDPKHLDAAIESVFAQVYPRWELCIADDASTDPRIRPALERWAEREPRVRVTFREQNGHISRATNSAASLATGEWLAFLDQDDLLAPDALGEVALHACEQPHCDVIYTDDDKIGEDGHRYAPQFKPDWSPELLLAYMYLSHLLVLRRTLFDAVGGLRAGFEGSQDHDLALRAVERARHVGHVPLPLYHWRAVAGSTATSGSAKPESFEAGRRAVHEALERRGVPAVVERPPWAVAGHLGLFAHRFPDDGPSVAIIIPTKDQLRALRVCIESLRSTTYRNYRVVVADNESVEPETKRYLSGAGVQVVPVANRGGKFSFSAVVNAAVRAVDADYVLLLNNDTEIRSPEWLSLMMGYARLPGVGAVGAHMVFPDGRTQHAGIVHGLHHGLAGHAFKLTPASDHGYLSYKAVCRNYLAATAACLLTPRALYLELGGFDESSFAVAYNDADYGYRLAARGRRVVYAPCQVLHYEGLSRGFGDDPREVATFRRRYKSLRDPYVSPHQSLADESLAIQPRRLVRSTRRVRALCFSHNLNHEGAPLHQYELAVELARRGDLEPVVMSPVEGPLRELYEQQGFEVHVVPGSLAGLDVSFEALLDALGKAMARLEPEVVYANTIHGFAVVAAAARIGLPSVWNIHESEGWNRLFEHLGPEIVTHVLESFPLPYRVVFVADATRDVYAALDTQRNFTVIHNGIHRDQLEAAERRWPRAETRRALGIEEGELVTLLLGTVCERKGQLDLPLALASQPHESWPRGRWFIVGDRGLPYSRLVSSAISSLPPGLRERVTMVPETPEAARYLSAADVFVCSSRIESFPRVILEAMAFGLPIVTTPVFGIHEQVRDGVNALLYVPGNPSQLGARLLEVLTDEALRERLASNARPVLDRLNDFGEMADAYAEILRAASLTGSGLPRSAAGRRPRPAARAAGPSASDRRPVAPEAEARQNRLPTG